MNVQSLNKAPVLEERPHKIDFKIIDGLRGIASVYVVCNHARKNLFIGGQKYSLIKARPLWTTSENIYFSAVQCTNLGREFVILFFILSGFSIASSLNQLPKIGGFYLRRIIRIYPPFIVSLIWAFVVFTIVKKYVPVALAKDSYSVFASLKGTIQNILYINNGDLIGQFWSLKFEVIFYLLVPVFILKKNFYFTVSLLFAIIGFFINWKNDAGSNTLGLFILDFNIYFACGVFCFHHFKTLSKIFTLKNRFTFYCVSGLLFLTMSAFKFWIFYDQNKITSIMATAFSIVLLFNFLHHNIKNKLLSFLGEISYSMYITHDATLMLFAALLLHFQIISSMEIQNKFIWMLGIPVSVGISYLFYLLIEKPTKNWLIKLRNSK